jgi:hypothetical protein
MMAGIGNTVDDIHPEIVPPVWRFYTALEFHEATLDACKSDDGQPLYRVRQ